MLYHLIVLVSYVLIFYLLSLTGIRGWSWEALDAVEKENKEKRINRWEVGRRWEAEEKWIELSPTEYRGPSNSTYVKQKRLVPEPYLFFPSSVDVTIFPHILASSQPVILLFSHRSSSYLSFLRSQLFHQLCLLNISWIHSLFSIPCATKFVNITITPC